MRGHDLTNNKLAKLQATLVGNYDSPTYSLTGVKCGATSVAKKTMTKTKTMRNTKTMTNTFRKHPQRVILDTFDP